MGELKVVVAWSGGKDSCFAYYKALKQGFTVVDLVTFMQNEELSNFHGIRSDILDAQAKALGVPIAKYVTTPKTYEQQFKDALFQCKAKGVEGLITGDIFEVDGHEKGWLERICGEVGLKPIRPLWMGDTKKLFQEFVAEGFEATVIRTKLSLLGEEWLGRKLDSKFFADVLALGNVDPCGESGEYHTVVTDGPFFNYAIKLGETEKSSYGGFGRLEILRVELEHKKQDA
jgi:diphthine-ammonia ligase